MNAKPFVPASGYTQADWDAVSEDADTTEAELAQAMTFDEAFPALAASARRARGLQKAPTKTLVSLRLSGDVIEKFKAGGPGWQTRIDEALRKVVGL